MTPFADKAIVTATNTAIKTAPPSNMNKSVQDIENQIGASETAIGMHTFPEYTPFMGMYPCTRPSMWCVPTGDGARTFEPVCLRTMPYMRNYWEDLIQQRRVALNGLTELEESRIQADVARVQNRYETGWLGGYLFDPGWRVFGTVFGSQSCQ